MAAKHPGLGDLLHQVERLSLLGEDLQRLRGKQGDRESGEGPGLSRIVLARRLQRRLGETQTQKEVDLLNQSLAFHKFRNSHWPHPLKLTLGSDSFLSVLGIFRREQIFSGEDSVRERESLFEYDSFNYYLLDAYKPGTHCSKHFNTLSNYLIFLTTFQIGTVSILHFTQKKTEAQRG